MIAKFPPKVNGLRGVFRVKNAPRCLVRGDIVGLGGSVTRVAAVSQGHRPEADCNFAGGP